MSNSSSLLQDIGVSESRMLESPSQELSSLSFLVNELFSSTLTLFFFNCDSALVSACTCSFGPIMFYPLCACIKRLSCFLCILLILCSKAYFCALLSSEALNLSLKDRLDVGTICFFCLQIWLIHCYHIVYQHMGIIYVYMSNSSNWLQDLQVIGLEFYHQCAFLCLHQSCAVLFCWFLRNWVAQIWFEIYCRIWLMKQGSGVHLGSTPSSRWLVYLFNCNLGDLGINHLFVYSIIYSLLFIPNNNNS